MLCTRLSISHRSSGTIRATACPSTRCRTWCRSSRPCPQQIISTLSKRIQIMSHDPTAVGRVQPLLDYRHGKLAEKLRSVRDVSTNLFSCSHTNLHAIFVLDCCRDRPSARIVAPEEVRRCQVAVPRVCCGDVRLHARRDRHQTMRLPCLEYRLSLRATFRASMVF